MKQIGRTLTRVREHMHRHIRPLLIIALVFVGFFIAGAATPLLPPKDADVSASYAYDDSVAFRQERAYYSMEAIVLPSAKNRTNLSLGVSTDTDRLHFGRMHTNMTTGKFITFSTPEPAHVTFHTFGDIAPHVITPEPFTLEGQRDVRITFNATDVPPANYSGTLVVQSVIPRNILGRTLLGMLT